MKTILVATDFSENAENAILYAAGMANNLHAKLYLVHILYIQGNESIEELEVLNKSPRLNICKKKLVATILRLQNQHQYYFEFETLCVFGENITVLNDIVKSIDVHLVIMGAKGCSDYFDKLIGSNTLDYIKKAVCPMLVIPAKASFNGIKKIVYSTDLSTDESIFLEQLFFFAKPFLAEVLILNVAEGKLLKDLGEDEIIECATPNPPVHNYSICQIKAEDVSQGIIQFTESNHVDLLAIALHKRFEIEDFFHRSVAKKIIIHTTLPLLSLPEEPYHIPPQTDIINLIKAELYRRLF